MLNKNYGIFVVFIIALFIALFIDLRMAEHKTSEIQNKFGTTGQKEEFQIRETDRQETPKKSETEEKNTGINIDKNVNIPINSIIEFSGMSVDEILSLRKKAVNNSPLFSNLSDYKPNPDVFQIEDGLQWISAYEISCNGADQPNIGKGPSRESIAILNPELMYYVSILNYAFSKYRMPCSPTDYLMPHRAFYDKNTNTITVHISADDLYHKVSGNMRIILSDANAHDLGYNYASAVNSTNIKYKNDFNLSNQIIQTRGFYHRGSSCGLPEGCNNYSPYESSYDFDITNLPAILEIKLWRNPPESASDKSDLNYRMVFE